MEVEAVVPEVVCGSEQWLAWALSLYRCSVDGVMAVME